MDDLDDLLGGPSNANTNKEIDDLLGDSPTDRKPPVATAAAAADLGAAFDDDLGITFDDDDDLLGGGPSASTSSAGPAATSSSPSTTAPAVPTNRPDNRILQKDNKFSAQSGGRKRAMGTINAQALRIKDAPSEYLAPYIGSATDVYYVRAVSVIDCIPANMNHSSSARYEAVPQRTRAVVRVSSTKISVYAPSHWDLVLATGSQEKIPLPTPTREIPVDAIFGVVTQSVVVPRVFGQNDMELQILIQVREHPDLLMAMTRDAVNNTEPNGAGSPEHDADILPTLAAVTLAYGITLPISNLHEGETIEKMLNRHTGKRGDEKLRGRQTEQLAFRTSLIEERKRLKSEIETMTVEIEKLKVSELARTADQIQTDINEHEKAISQFKKNLASIEGIRATLTYELQKVNGRIKDEAYRREKVAKETMAAAQHEAFKRQVAEFELMKNAHKREMDRLSNLISFEERRLKSRTVTTGAGGGSQVKTNYNGVLEISDRLEVLEQEDKFLEDQLARGQAHQKQQMSVLGIAKKETMPEGRKALQDILDEIKLLQQLKERMDFEANDAKVRAQPEIYTDILSKIKREPPVPLKLPTVAEPTQEQVIAAQVSSPPTATTNTTADPSPSTSAAPSAVPPAPQKPPISLDDSDDDLPIVKPAPTAAPAPAPKPSIVLDDDEI